MESAQIIRKREILKGSLTRIKRFVDSFDESNSDLCSEVEFRLDALKELHSQFEELQLELVDSSVSVEEINHENDLFEREYFPLISKLKKLVTKCQNPEAIVLGKSKPSVKLPLIDLPKFDGKFENWISFKDTYVSLIHENCSLDNIQKLHYLKSCLKDRAAELLQNLSITDTNYSICWDILTSRFENKRLITQSLIKSMLDIPKMSRHTSSELNTLCTEYFKLIRALKALGYDTQNSNYVLVPILSTKLDIVTQKKWEETINDNTQIPSLSVFEEFIVKQINIMELSVNDNKSYGSKPFKASFNNYKKSSGQNNVVQSYQAVVHRAVNNDKSHQTVSKIIDSSKGATTSKIVRCFLCGDEHYMYRCKYFVGLSVDDRIKKVIDLDICKICFCKHRTEECKARRYIVCQTGQHHVLLHQDKGPKNVLCLNNSENNVLLATAIVNVQDATGNSFLARVLLDSGAQGNFICAKLVQKLNLPRVQVDIPIQGICNVISKINYKTTAVVGSRIDKDFKFCSEFLIVNKITEKMPSNVIDITNWKIPSDISLADPEFNRPKNIEILIGGEQFFDLMLTGKIKINTMLPTLTKTKLGWIVAGKYCSSFPNHHLVINHNAAVSSNHQEQELLTRFWNIEECLAKKLCDMTPDECAIEKFYEETVRRDSNGRYIVSLPFKRDPSVLGKCQSASKRFFALERKLKNNPELHHQYQEFIDEYLQLGHMKQVSEEEFKGYMSCYFLPHHAVFKDSITTKLRVVFDGSCKNSSGFSLNQLLHKGPNLLKESFDLIIRFRRHRWALTADLQRFYRQVWINEDDTKYLLIFWRNTPNDTLKMYKLLTVTYGTTSAPYLAIKTLQKLAQDELENFPVAAKAAEDSFFMDDLLSGADTEEELFRLYNELNSLFLKGGFELRKWCTNHPTFFNQVDYYSDDPNYVLNISEDKGTKTLGLYWCPKSDKLKFCVNMIEHKVYTKRVVLSDIAKLYDPIGLLGPLITKAKVFIQQLWRCNLNWDDPLPENILNDWLQFTSTFNHLNKFCAPRYFSSNIPHSVYKYEIHCFCDASEVAYGACIYLKTYNDSDEIDVQLLCSKSRVAPIKQLTVPRLELCGALLLSNLYNKVVSALKMTIDEVYFWCDSEIVLTWLSGEPRKWNTFVANRVSQIQQMTDISKWNHVRSSCNPADPLSRGLTAEQLLDSRIWLSGPEWLLQSPNQYSTTEFVPNTEGVPEAKSIINIMIARESFKDIDFLKRYSSWFRFYRIVAYILRFASNCKKRRHERLYGILTIEELKVSQNLCIRLSQRIKFPEEYDCLKKEKGINKNSKLINLDPFIDAFGVMRVGGRLDESKITYSQKHPILLMDRHDLTEMIIREFHIKYLHAGPSSLLYQVRLIFWPLNGKNLCKKIVRNCVICSKVKPLPIKYKMGNLPEERINPSKPFTFVGVDYAGPLLIKESKRRNASSSKVYICVFVCFATKALHLELVSALTTDAFIASFKRFIARRGLCTNIYSDNGSNFIGANNLLKDLYKLIQSGEFQNKIKDAFSHSEIKWSFIPSRSPTFGSIWEAGVKSIKYHLRRVMANQILNFEELSTLLTQIEACLNSRPLYPESSSPKDLNALTPAHFLIGQTLDTLPEPCLLDVNMNLLDRWQRIQAITQQFWKRWSKEYLGYLQTRSKWKTPGN